MHRISPFAGYQGRISRSTYWSYIWPFMVVLLMVQCVDVMAFGVGGERGFLAYLVGFIVALPAWRIGLKRCHDRGHSGLYIFLLSMIPVIGPLWLFVELGLLEGTRGTNRYGPDPAQAVTA